MLHHINGKPASWEDFSIKLHAIKKKKRKKLTMSLTPLYCSQISPEYKDLYKSKDCYLQTFISSMGVLTCI